MTRMTKMFTLTLVVFVAGMACGAVKSPAKGKTAMRGPVKWVLKYTDDFNGAQLKSTLWKRVDAGDSDWNKNMSLREDLVDVKDGSLHLYGVVNTNKVADSRNFLTGGVSTCGAFNMKYGKVEVRARLEAAKGAWPAVWMMPERPVDPWPLCGEIDILERLNYDSFVYQTVHSQWTKTNAKDPPSGGKGEIKPDAWNIYALEWTLDKIVWRVNGSLTHTYPRLSDEKEKWPWDKPFYLIIDMQLGGKWVGEVDGKDLPVAMHIDWVKFYQLYQGTTEVSEFSRP